MRIALFVALLLLTGCDGVWPGLDGHHVSRATSRSMTDNALGRAQEQAKRFCRQRGLPLIIEATTSSTRPEPAKAAIFFHCGHRPAATVQAVPTTVPDPPSSVHVPEPVAPVVVDTPAPPDISGRAEAIVVSFASPGTGIDPAAEATLRVMLDELARERGHALPRRDRHWGREGEYDACIDLGQVGAARRKAFVQQLRERLRGSQFTHLGEASGCNPMPGWEVEPSSG